VGQRLAYDLKEQFAASRQHGLVYTPQDAGFKLKVVTLNPDRSEGTQTIYSVTLTMSSFDDKMPLDYYLTSWVGKCGASVTEACAKDIVAGVNEEITPIVEAVTKASRK
jgi:hypothetical protein